MCLYAWWNLSTCSGGAVEIMLTSYRWDPEIDSPAELSADRMSRFRHDWLFLGGQTLRWIDALSNCQIVSRCDEFENERLPLLCSMTDWKPVHHVYALSCSYSRVPFYYTSCHLFSNTDSGFTATMTF